MIDDAKDVTLGELARRLSAHERRVDGQFVRLEGLIQSQQFVPMDLYLSERKAQDDKIDAQAESLRWTRRAALGAVIAAVTPLVFTAVLVKGGG